MVEMSGCELSIVQQCILLSLCRSTLYYKPEGQETDLNLKLMEELDKQYLKTPFYGFRKMTMHLKNLGYAVNRKRVRRLIRLMGLESDRRNDYLS
jgi:putative transposase